MIDITDYGAVGDGATDSTEAVRAALAAAAAAGGTVLVPEGRFSVRGLAVPNGVRGIQGVSPASYQNHRTGSVLELRREGAERALLDLSGCKDLFCRDLALVGNTIDYSGCVGMHFEDANALAISGNVFWRSGCTFGSIPPELASDPYANAHARFRRCLAEGPCD